MKPVKKMISPNFEKVLSYAKDYSIIPIYKEIYADIITPINLLRKLSVISKRYFLLENVEGGEKWGRYSFLGFDPLMRVTCKEGNILIEQNGKIIKRQTDKPFDIIREIKEEYKSPKLDNMPPLTGGFVGYFAYSMINYAEPKLKIKRGEFNDLDLMLFDKIIAFDHLKQKIYIIVNIKTDNINENYNRAIAELEAISCMIHDSKPLPKIKTEKNIQFTCNLNKEDYCEIVEQAKRYIRDGDIFQAVLSRQFTATFKGSLINAYRVLRTTNPSPYMVYMSIDNNELMCSSPETLVRLQNGRLTTFPVAGSRPRGKTAEEDKKLEEELLSDEKELSEHNMLVDLGRNDLGKISEYASVKVTEYMMIHRYSKIMHICSQVESNILPNRDGCSAIEAVLPAGTLSGAPKIRACEIIEELEKQPRGIYGGALGYLDFTGNMDTCIAIRMAVKEKDKVYVQAGGGIVADSIPENEYIESANKALAIMNAICMAGEVDDE